MLRNILLLAFLLIAALNLNAQKKNIKGIVQDDAQHFSLSNVSIVLIQFKDSFIVADTRSKPDGSFSLQNLTPGSYTLLFTRPGYVDFSRRIDIDSLGANTLELKNIGLFSKEVLLNDVIIKSKLNAIKIKGDTTEINAASVKVAANASVEELLKQLPSIQIDQAGNITAQGKRVKTVLVDGEEFFGNDPLLVTRNLRADMINTVQIYDKKSDEATFTGINDGIKNKTINLKLKEDKKSGYFGKLNSGIGNDKFYNGQGMFNLFRDKRKLSTYITTSNIGLSGLAQEDKDRFASDEDGNGSYDGKGIPKVTSGGIHYDDKWDQGKNSINTNVKLNHNSRNELNTVQTENNLPTGIQRSYRTNESQNTTSKSQYNLTFLSKYSERSTLKVYSDATLQQSSTISTSNYDNKTEKELSLLNNNSSRSFNDTYRAFNLNIDWQNKFKKQGRTFSSYLKSNYSNYSAEGISFSRNTFFNINGGVDSIKTLDFNKTDHYSNKNINLLLIYTEPISKSLSLGLNYTSDYFNNSDDKISLNKSPNGRYEQIDYRYSNHYETNQLKNKIGASLNYSLKKVNAKVSNNIGQADIKMTDIDSRNILRKHFLILEPSLAANYKFNDYKAIELNYNGSANQPSNNQLQPSKYNNNLLVSYLPNINLSTSFTNRLNLAFSKYSLSTQSYFSIAAGFAYTRNPIEMAMQTDSSGIYTYQYTNLNGRSNREYSFSSLYNRKINFIDAQFFGVSTISGIRTFSLINNVLNTLNTKNYSIQLGLSKDIPKKYAFNITGTIGYAQNNFSIRQDLNNDYLNFLINPSVSYFITKSIQLHTDANYTWEEKTQSFDKNFERFIWNASLSKNLFKGDPLVIKLACNDILNKNVGFRRSATNNFFSQSSYITIQRFFMVSAIWNFNKFNVKKQ